MSWRKRRFPISGRISERAYCSRYQMGDITNLVVYASLLAEDGETDRNLVLSQSVDLEEINASSLSRSLEQIPSSSSYESLSSEPNEYKSKLRSQHHSVSSTPDSRSSDTVLSTLYGTVVAECSFCTDLDGCPSAFFVFSDCCIRVEGQYRLKFTLVDTKS
jgi:hypothetical protein